MGGCVIMDCSLALTGSSHAHGGSHCANFNSNKILKLPSLRSYILCACTTYSMASLACLMLCDSVSCVSLSYPRTATPCRRTRRPSSCARSNPATAPLTSTPGRRQRGPRRRRQRGRRRRRRRRRRGGLRRRRSCVEQFRDTIESVCIFLER